MQQDSRSWLDKLFYPSPNERKDNKIGYSPSALVKLIRNAADIFIGLFNLNSNNKLAVEIQQKLNPVIEVALANGQSLKFTGGHGRLIWRAKTLLTEEPSIIEWIDGFGDNEVFYDIGANVGTYALYACKTKNSNTFAFEPEINNAQLLYSNVYINKMSQICTPLILACDCENGIKPFYIREFTKGGAINGIETKSFQLEDESQMFVQGTPCIKLDDAIDILKLPMPTKIKIDVDGNELRVIKGALKALDYANSVYIELFDDFEEHNEVKTILLEKGYSLVSRDKIKATTQYNNMANYIFTKQQ